MRHFGMRFWVLAAVLALAGGCTNDDKDSGSSGQSLTLTYYQDAAPVFESRCVTCHQPGEIGPMPLTSRDRIILYKDEILASLDANTMPPWPASSTCREIADSGALSDSERELIKTWFAQGALEGDAEKPAPIPTPIPNGISRVDLSLHMPDWYTPSDYPDEYRCFLMDWPYDTVKYITGFQANPGNTKIVHHIAVYLISPSLAEKARSRVTDPAKGYSCYGGPNVSDDPLDPFVLVGVWGPGMIARDFPANSGLRVEPGSLISIQMHYATENGFEPDLTEVQFKIDDTVEREGAMLPFLDLQWVIQQTMNIPAGDPDVMHSYATDPTASFIYNLYTNGVIKPGEPFDIHSSNLHMHTRGHSTSTSLRRKDGGEECLLEIPRWDFHWQFFYQFAESVRVNPGDELYVECHWDNSGWVPGAAPHDSGGGHWEEPVDLNWGEGTGDEMCVATFYVTGN